MADEDHNYANAMNIHHPSDEDASIHQVLSGSFIGLFRVSLNQALPHPRQRLINPKWVESLSHRFKNGIDRGSHPFQAVLATRESEEDLKRLFSKSSELTPTLPAGIRVYVFDGQHRLEAWKGLCTAPDDLFWFGKIYSKDLEEHNPAEFLAAMHGANEEEFKRPTQDADRFIAVHALKQLVLEKKIRPEQFTASKSRLQGPDESVRRGISNLIRNPRLSEAVAAALRQPHVRVHFKASAWRKLTQGYFYEVAASLVDEMVVQCQLLAHGEVDVPEDAFGLQARVCEIDKLSQSIKSNSKAHKWQSLPGGASAALKRVCSRPADFVSNINPNSKDGWTFPSVILLPSVLSSHHVEGALKQMTTIGQHIIRIIANEEEFRKYTSSNPHLPDEDSIVFATVVRQAMRHKSDLVPGYENKIIYRMWTGRTTLMEDLAECRVPEAKDASKETYLKLLLESSAWMELLQLFKTSKFRDGWQLRIPTSKHRPGDVPGPSTQHQPQEKALSLSAKGTMFKASEPTTSAAEPGSQGQVVNRSSKPQEAGAPLKRQHDTASGAPAPTDDFTGNTETDHVSESGGSSISERPAQRRRLDDSDGENSDSGSEPSTHRIGAGRVLAKHIHQLDLIKEDLTSSEANQLAEIVHLITRAKGLSVLDQLLKAMLREGKSHLQLSTNTDADDPAS